MRLATLALFAACASPDREPPPLPPSIDAAVPAPAPDPRHWLAGDLHMHVSPIDDREGTTLTARDLAARAHDAGLAFLILTPHLHPSTWRDAKKRAAWIARWRAMAADARSAAGVTMIAGTEYTVTGFGHFGVSGIDLGNLSPRGDFLANATAAGAMVIVNHPFAVPTHIAGYPVSETDMSFRPWTEGKVAPPHLDGVEVWNLPLSLANTISRPGGASGEERAFVEADALARQERQHVAIVGGSDNHHTLVMATTWVLATDASPASIAAALHAGATCVGGPEAGTLEARGDDGTWARIGEVVHATARVTLRWSGRAELFVDGVDRGGFDGGFTDDAAAGVHTYRITQGASRCGFVYANL